MNFIDHNINQLYRAVLTELLIRRATVAPRDQKISEVIGARVVLTDAARCLLTWPERKLNYHFAVAEWWWIATGRDDVASIAPYCSEIARFSDDGARFFGAYGSPWTNQVGYVVRKLREDLASRQAALTIWRPNPPATKDVPCTLAMQYLARDGALHAVVTMRSWDAWLGLPYDVFNFGRLLALVAGEVGLPIGSLIVNAGSLHLYERNRDAAKELVKTPTPLGPQLDRFPGLIPEHLRALPMDRVDLDEIDEQPPGCYPWLLYLAVLEHRWRRDATRLPSLFRELLP